MERLTIRNSDGSVSQPTSTNYADVFVKLAAYEDICPDPEEIAKLLAEQKRITSVMAEVGIEKYELSTMLKQALYNELAGLIVNEILKHPEYYEIKTTDDFKKDNVRFRMRIKVVSLLANEEDLR